MRGSRDTDVTPPVWRHAALAASVGCTAGWVLNHRGGNFFEIRAPHPNGKDNWWTGVADLTTSREHAERIFAALMMSSCCVCALCQHRKEMSGQGR